MKRKILILAVFLFSASLCGCQNNNNISDPASVLTTEITDEVPAENKYQFKISDSPGDLEMIQSIYPVGDDFYVPGYGETEKSEEAVILVDTDKKTSEDILVCRENENIISTLLSDKEIYVCFSDPSGRIMLRAIEKNSKKTEKETVLEFEKSGTAFIRQIFAGDDGRIYLLADLTDTENANERKNIVYSLDDDLNIIKGTELNIHDENSEIFSALKIQSCASCFWLLAECSNDSDDSQTTEENGKIFRVSKDFSELSELETTEENDFSSVYDFGISQDEDLLLCVHSSDALSENNVVFKYDTQNMTVNGKFSSNDIERLFFSYENENEVYYSGSDGILYRYNFDADEKTEISEENDAFAKDIANAASINRSGKNMLLTCLQEENVDSILMYKISSDGVISDGVAVSSVFENGYSDRIFISDDGCFLTFEKSNIVFGGDSQTVEMPSYLINRCSDSGKITDSFEVATYLGTDVNADSDALFSDKKLNNYLLCSIEGKIKKQSKLLVTDKYGKQLINSDIREKYDYAQFIMSKDKNEFLALLLKNRIVLYSIDAEKGIVSENRELELDPDDGDDSFLSIYQGRDTHDLYLLSEKGRVYGVSLSSNTFDILFDSDFAESVPESLEIDRVFPLCDNKIVFTAYTDDAEEKICIVSKCESENQP